MPAIYLDHNATTPLDPRVAEAMWECERQFPANPSSQHAAGRRAREALEEATEAIAALLGVPLGGARPARLVFTSGGTEANNLAILGLCASPSDRLVVAGVEHSSLLGPAGELVRRGNPVDTVRVDRDGRIDLEHLAALLDRPVRLVSIQTANHETGVLQPLAEAAALAAAQGALLHTDAVQAVGKIPVDFAALGVSALSAAAHKFRGPRGIGLLALAHGIEPRPQAFGGFQQHGLRPGTEPLALVVGMRVALELWQAAQVELQATMTALRDRLEAELRTYPGAVVHACRAPRLPQTSAVSFPGLDRQSLLMALDLAGVACSTGSACASGSSEPSPVLQAMGCDPPLIASALRFSLGSATTAAEVAEAARRILKTCNDLRERQNRGKNPLASRTGGGNSL